MSRHRVDGEIKNPENKNKIYLQVWAACRQHDLVRLQVLTLSRQRAINQRTALQQRVEHAYQRALVVVPAQTKMLAVRRHV